MKPARSVLLPLALAAHLVTPGAAQVALQAPDTAIAVADAGDVAGAARAAQARFESRRIRLLPLSYETFGGSCDEIVGRICNTYDEGEWYPQPETDAIAALREALLAELDSLQRLAPTEPFVVGQRVWYRAEGGDWPGALRVARDCEAEPWWCRSLEGFALHGLGRYMEAEAVFASAFEVMDSERARRWSVPRWPVDGDTRDLLEQAEGDPAAEARLLDRLWALADPLWLVEGNDRWTAHLARWTVTELRERARNPFRLAWGEDLTQLTVRHGWQIGWERTPSRDYTSVDNVIGHNHPMGRDYMPAGEVLEDPVLAEAPEMVPDIRSPRSLYAPQYAPVLLPTEGQVALFPRDGETVVVATHYLPDDTTFHAGHRHRLPWLEPGEQASMPDRTGLFALDLEDPRALPRGVTTRGRVDGASVLSLPPGHWVVSIESWSPPRRRAGRARVGVAARSVTPDIATLSDILLLRPVGAEPATLLAAVDRALPRPCVRPGETFAIGWEVAGLGFRPEALVFEVSVERVGRGVFDRIGDFLGLSEPPRPLALSWEEPGPAEPRSVFRYLALDVPELEEGTYEVRLVLRTRGRSDAHATRRFEVVAPR